MWWHCFNYNLICSGWVVFLNTTQISVVQCTCKRICDNLESKGYVFKSWAHRTPRRDQYLLEHIQRGLEIGLGCWKMGDRLFPISSQSIVVWIILFSAVSVVSKCLVELLQHLLIECGFASTLLSLLFQIINESETVASNSFSNECSCTRHTIVTYDGIISYLSDLLKTVTVICYSEAGHRRFVLELISSALNTLWISC